MAICWRYGDVCADLVANGQVVVDMDSVVRISVPAFSGCARGRSSTLEETSIIEDYAGFVPDGAAPNGA